MSKTDISLTCAGIAFSEDARGLIEKRSNYSGQDKKPFSLLLAMWGQGCLLWNECILHSPGYVSS